MFEDFVGFDHRGSKEDPTAIVVPVPGYSLEEYLRTFSAYAEDDSTYVLCLPKPPLPEGFDFPLCEDSYHLHDE